MVMVGFDTSSCLNGKNHLSRKQGATMGVNKVLLLGRLGKDPELRYTANKTPVATFSLATGDRRKDSSGTWVEHTEWHNIVVFGKTAENCSNYLKKGREVFVEGRIQTRKWQDKEGRDRWSTEIVANTVQFIGGRDSNERSSAPSNGHTSGGDDSNAGPAFDDNIDEVTFEDDDIPF